jgi:hypothetical protein
MKGKQEMRRVHKVTAIAVAATLAGSVLVTGIARANLLGSIVKGGVIAVLIKQFNRPLNDAINKVTDSAGASPTEATKVVPIVSIGQGGYVGAAQVSGDRDRLDEVQAVGLLEGSLNGKQFRLKALVPISTTQPGKGSISRVKGVGVSAIIDIKV